MKQIRNFVMLSLMTLMLGLVSCGGPDMKAINEKIEKEGNSATFTQKEYAAMADYLEKNIEKQLEVETKNMDWEESEKYMEKNFPHMDDYLFILALADAEGELDGSNSAKFNKIKQKTIKIIQDAQETIMENYDDDYDF